MGRIDRRHRTQGRIRDRGASSFQPFARASTFAILAGTPNSFKLDGKALLKPVQTVINGVPFGRPYQAPFAVR